MKLLAALLRTRTRIFASLSFLLALMFLYLGWAVPWMEDASTSIGSNLLVILFWMLQATLVAFYVSVVVGDITLGKGWRAQFFDHAPLDLAEADLELGLLSKQMRARTFQFSILYTLCAVFVLLTSNMLAGDFFGHYQKVSYFKTIFRGEKVDLKLDALDTLSNAWGPDLINQTPIILSVYKTEKDPLLHDKTFDALSAIAYTVRAAANPRSHLSAAKAPLWKHKVSALLRDGMLSELKETLASSTDTASRTRAWMILATVSPESILAEAKKTPEDKTLLEKEDRVSLVLALSWLNGEDAVEALRAELADNRHPQTRITALWALGNFLRTYEAPKKNDGQPEEYVQITINRIKSFIDSEHLDTRCAALVSLGKAGDMRLLETYVRAIQTSTAEQQCVTQEIHIPNRRPELMYKAGSLQFRALEALAYIARGNEAALNALKDILGSRQKYDEKFVKQVQDVLNRAVSN